MLRLITHTGYIINRNKCLRINLIDKLHQLLIFTFIHNRNNLIMLFQIIGSYGFIDCCSTMQILNNKLSKFFFLPGDNADAPFSVLIKNK